MLPFLKPKQAASVIMAKYSPDKPMEALPENEMHPKLMEHAEQLVSAIHGKDARAAAEAIQAMQSHINGDKHE